MYRRCAFVNQSRWEPAACAACTQPRPLPLCESSDDEEGEKPARKEAMGCEARRDSPQEEMINE